MVCPTLMADADPGRNNLQNSVPEDTGSKTALVTVTLTGIRFGTGREVTAVVGGGTEGTTDNATVANFVITMSAGQENSRGNLTLNPTDDDIDDEGETVRVVGILTDVTSADTDCDFPMAAAVTKTATSTTTILEGMRGVVWCSRKVRTCVAAPTARTKARANIHRATELCFQLSTSARPSSQKVPCSAARASPTRSVSGASPARRSVRKCSPGSDAGNGFGEAANFSTRPGAPIDGRNVLGQLRRRFALGDAGPFELLLDQVFACTIRAPVTFAMVRSAPLNRGRRVRQCQQARPEDGRGSGQSATGCHPSPPPSCAAWTARGRFASPAGRWRPG